jgi:hypothetical protein
MLRILKQLKYFRKLRTIYILLKGIIRKVWWIFRSFWELIEGTYRLTLVNIDFAQPTCCTFVHKIILTDCFFNMLPNIVSKPYIKWHYSCFHAGESLHCLHVGIIDGRKLEGTKLMCPLILWCSCQISYISVCWLKAYWRWSKHGFKCTIFRYFLKIRKLY